MADLFGTYQNDKRPRPGTLSFCSTVSYTRQGAKRCTQTLPVLAALLTTRHTQRLALLLSSTAQLLTAPPAQQQRLLTLRARASQPLTQPRPVRCVPPACASHSNRSSLIPTLTVPGLERFAAARSPALAAHSLASRAAAAPLATASSRHPLASSNCPR